MLKGLTAGILQCKRIGNCSAGGISAHCSRVTIVGLGIPEIFEAHADSPAVRIVMRWKGTPREYMHAEPIDQPAGMVGPMAGGTFIYSNDSRFPATYPIPLHDRFETQAMAESMD